MPSCFSLTRKGEDSPSILSHVDNHMRMDFGAEPDSEHWYRNWYNTIGLSLAIGHSLEKIKEFFPDKADIIDWLAANYDSNSWKEFK